VSNDVVQLVTFAIEAASTEALKERIQRLEEHQKAIDEELTRMGAELLRRDLQSGRQTLETVVAGVERTMAELGIGLYRDRAGNVEIRQRAKRRRLSR
jgi:hypothetical protein